MKLTLETERQLKLIVRDIQKQISKSIRFINAGGCGWFAYLFSRELKKYGIECNLIILDSYQEFEDKKNILNKVINKEYVDEYLVSCTSFSHCCVGVGEHFVFDGKEMNPIPDWTKCGYPQRGEYTTKEMRVALKYGNWNPTYNPKQNTKLKNIIAENLKKLNKSLG